MPNHNGRVLVTGVNGFVGGHAARDLAAHGYEVVGLAREERPSAALPLSTYVQADLTQPWPKLPEIDAVIHLAGLSAVGPSFDQPQTYVDVNSAIVNHMAAWSAAHAPASRAIVVSSGAVYDSTYAGELTEEAPLAFTSPYVVSKVLVENLVAYYRRRGLDWLVVRPFNHIGPGQGPGFLLPDLVDQLAALESDNGAIQVGDLSTARDYTDVRDVVRAYRLLLDTDLGREWIFNICSGESHTGTELLDAAAKAAGRPPVMVEVDERRIRPNDPRDVRGSYERLQRLTGWRPDREFAASVVDFVAARQVGEHPRL